MQRLHVVAHLPYQQPPKLFIAPQVRHDLDVKEMLGVRDADENGGGNEAEEQELGDGGCGEAGSEHVFGWPVRSSFCMFLKRMLR